MMRMLIVDDEEWIVEGLKVQMPWEQMGIVLTSTAENGQGAIEIIDQEEPDIILTDIRMPLMDGLELAKYIYENQKECEVIIVSGYADFAYAKQAITYQVSAYITKPIEYDEVQKAIIKSMGKVKERRKKREKIVFEEKSRKLYNEIEIDYDNIRDLMGFIEFGNRKATKDAFHNLAQKWETTDNPLLAIRMNVQETLIQLSSLLQKYESNMYKVNKEYFDIFNRIWEIKSFDMLEDICSVLINDILEYINQVKNGGAGSIVCQIKKYMDKHYKKPITLNDMANAYYINAAYLSRAFKREVGSGFNDYLNQIRMNQAVNLLVNSNLKIYEVASEVGYENENYFMKKFKEKYDVTPKQYKENHKLK